MIHANVGQVPMLQLELVAGLVPEHELSVAEVPPLNRQVTERV